jgi:hypothetical protein
LHILIPLARWFLLANVKSVCGHKLIFSILAMLACCCWSFGGNYLEEIKRKASEGDRDARSTLAYLYRSGKGVPKDFEKAKKWEYQSHQDSSSSKRANPSSYRRITPREILLPSRLESNLRDSLLREDSTPLSNYYASNASFRMPPTRPEEQLRAPTSRESPQRPAKRTLDRAGRVNDSRHRYERLTSDVESYRRFKKKPQNQLIKGGRIIISPITFTLKTSKKAVSKVARKMAWASIVP